MFDTGLLINKHGARRGVTGGINLAFAGHDSDGAVTNAALALESVGAAANMPGRDGVH